MKEQDAPNYLLLTGITICTATTAYLLWKKQKEQTENQSQDSAKSVSHTVNPSRGQQGPQQEQAPTSEVKQPNWRSPFDMRYADDVLRWVAPRKLKMLDQQKALQLAEKIKQAKGRWFEDDNEDAIEQVFSKILEDKVQVALLSKFFYQRYKLDLWEYLRSFLSAAEMDRYVHTPVRSLPNYRLE